jgi:hypothetical protein
MSSMRSSSVAACDQLRHVGKSVRVGTLVLDSLKCKIPDLHVTQCAVAITEFLFSALSFITS